MPSAMLSMNFKAAWWSSRMTRSCCSDSVTMKSAARYVICVCLTGDQMFILSLPQVLVVEDGKIRQYPGDFDDYRNELIKEITAELDEE